MGSCTKRHVFFRRLPSDPSGPYKCLDFLFLFHLLVCLIFEIFEVSTPEHQLKFPKLLERLGFFCKVAAEIQRNPETGSRNREYNYSIRKIGSHTVHSHCNRLDPTDIRFGPETIDRKPQNMRVSDTADKYRYLVNANQVYTSKKFHFNLRILF